MQPASSKHHNPEVDGRIQTIGYVVFKTLYKYNDVQACHLHGRLISQKLNWHHGIALGLYDFCPVKIWKRSSRHGPKGRGGLFYIIYVQRMNVCGYRWIKNVSVKSYCGQSMFIDSSPAAHQVARQVPVLDVDGI